MTFAAILTFARLLALAFFPGLILALVLTLTPALALVLTFRPLLVVGVWRALFVAAILAVHLALALPARAVLSFLRRIARLTLSITLGLLFALGLALAPSLALAAPLPSGRRHPATT